MDRRIFLKSGGLALLGTALVPDAFVRMARASGTRGKKVLVAIFQRGAVDGLNVVVPYGDRGYYASRRSIAIPRVRALDLDGFFGAHPALAPLMPFWKERSLAAVHAVGSPDSTRSHFDAQDFMESGTPGRKSTADGFLSRALATRKGDAPPLRAVALAQSMPRILSGSAGAIATSDITRFRVRGGAHAEETFESMYAESVAGVLGETAKQSFEAARVLASLEARGGASYPRNPLGDSLRQIAQLVRADVGLEVGFTDAGGWDTHVAQGGEEGQLANNLRGMAEAIAAFANDLGSRMSDVVLVTMSEFGRTVRENGNRGTDHGHGTVMLLLGGGVKGGRVHGRWPGLEREQQFEGRDLAVTTDFRDVFAEVLRGHLGVPSMASVFPGYEPKGLGVV